MRFTRPSASATDNSFVGQQIRLHDEELRDLGRYFSNEVGEGIFYLAK